jgi:hypothetical protein
VEPRARAGAVGDEDGRCERRPRALEKPWGREGGYLPGEKVRLAMRRVEGKEYTREASPECLEIERLFAWIFGLDRFWQVPG